MPTAAIAPLMSGDALAAVEHLDRAGRATDVDLLADQRMRHRIEEALPEGDTAFAKRLARYCARNPVALERLTYDGAGAPVRQRSDKRDGPTAGPETVDPLEFLARVVTHIPNKHQVMSGRAGAAAASRGPAAVGRVATAHL